MWNVFIVLPGIPPASDNGHRNLRNVLGVPGSLASCDPEFSPLCLNQWLLPPTDAMKSIPWKKNNKKSLHWGFSKRFKWLEEGHSSKLATQISYPAWWLAGQTSIHFVVFFLLTCVMKWFCLKDDVYAFHLQNTLSPCKLSTSTFLSDTSVTIPCSGPFLGGHFKGALGYFYFEGDFEVDVLEPANLLIPTELNP